MMRPEQIPYGVKDFRDIREKGLYYVDKTAYIRELEQRARYPASKFPVQQAPYVQC